MSAVLYLAFGFAALALTAAVWLWVELAQLQIIVAQLLDKPAPTLQIHVLPLQPAEDLMDDLRLTAQEETKRLFS